MKQRDKIVMIRVEQAIRDKLERLADAWSMSLSGAVRRLIIEAKMPKTEREG